MMERQDQEGPSPGTLSDDCQETWVDSTEVVVLDAACDWHTIIAALLGGGLTKHVAELGAAVLRTPCHLREERGREERGGGQSRRIISQSYGDGAFYSHVPFSHSNGRCDRLQCFRVNAAHVFAKCIYKTGNWFPAKIKTHWFVF